MVTSFQHNCKEELRELDLRATPTRLAIMKFLEASDKPVDVNMIIDYLNKEKLDTDPATAFRIINVFTQKGITKQISFNDGKFRYELSTREDHHHLICEACGKVQDISDCAIPALEKDIKIKKKFLVKSHSLEFYGLCANCQREVI